MFGLAAAAPVGSQSVRPQYDLISASYSWDVDVASGSAWGGAGSSSGSSDARGTHDAAALGSDAPDSSSRRSSPIAPTSPNFPGAGTGTDDELQGWRRHRSGVRIARTGIDDDDDDDDDGKLDLINGGSASRWPHPRHFDAPVATHIIDAVLARVRNVGEAHGAPDSVHEATRRMRRRKSVAPPSWMTPATSEQSAFHSSSSSSSSSSSIFSSLSFWPRKSGRSLGRRARETLLSPIEAPRTIDAATAMLGRDVASRAAPHANIALPDVLHASMTIGTGAAGGPHSVVATPLQEPFSVFVPPPFRIIFLVALGLLCWAANLRGLRRTGIDADGMLANESKIKVLPQHRARGEQLMSSAASISTTSSSRTLVGSADSEIALFFRHPWLQETSAFQLGLICLIWGIACWVSYRIYAFHTIFYGGDHMGSFAEARGRHAQALQGIAVFGMVVVALWPGDVLFRARRKAFGRLLLRVCSPSLYQRIYFSDVVLADILTSFARVFGDMWLTMCFLWPTSETPAWWNGKGSIAVPLLVSLPYLIRFRQCISEYNTAAVNTTGPKPLRPLFNAAKYFSAFPVIWLSVLQTKGTSQDDPLVNESASPSFYFWVLSVFVNSLYSFWWDVTNDWGLQMFSWSTWSSTPSRIASSVRSMHRNGTSGVTRLTSRSAVANGQHGDSRANGDGMSKSPSGSTLSVPSHARRDSRLLRSDEHAMLYPPIAYQLAVTIDLLLRFAWSLKLSSHLHHIIELESTAFYLEALEILRRWMWTFLRVEWEACRRKAWDNDGSMESLTLATLRNGSLAQGNGEAAQSSANHHVQHGPNDHLD